MKSAACKAQDAARFPLLRYLRNNWRQGYLSPLARRFVFITIGCSSLLALLITGIQLYADYLSERSILTQSIADIQKTRVPGLVESLWIIDELLVQSQLEGIVHVEGVEYAEVVDTDGLKIAVGEVASAFGQRHEFPLERLSDQKMVTLGTLRLFVSFDAIVDRVIQRAAVILLTNAMKTLAVASVILLIYQLLIGRHMAKLSSFASGYDPESPPSPFALDREPVSAHGDELTKLELAMNHLIDANRDYIDRLQDAKDTIAQSREDLRMGHEALKARTEELDATNKKLHVANQEQAEFAYAISHDLKSPAVSVGMLLNEIWEESGEQLDPDSVEMFKRAQQLIDRMGRQVESVLDYSKTITATLALETVDLSQTFAHVVDDLSGMAKQADASINIGELPLVVGNASLLSMLFLNLLSNALKFRAPDRPPKVWVDTQPGERPETICISVRDNGIGIAKDHHEQIFGLFKRLHLQSDYPGTGIGLALCQRIVAKHEGTIEVHSDVGVGTTFYITLRHAAAGSQCSDAAPFRHAIGDKVP